MRESTRTIVCTEENAADFRRLARVWPELGGLIAQLQAQDLFPGLRAMRITFTGAAAAPGKGVGALADEIAKEASNAN